MSATSKFQKRLMEGKPMFNYDYDLHVRMWRQYNIIVKGFEGPSSVWELEKNAWYPNYERYK